MFLLQKPSLVGVTLSCRDWKLFGSMLNLEGIFSEIIPKCKIFNGHLDTNRNSLLMIGLKDLKLQGQHHNTDKKLC